MGAVFSSKPSILWNDARYDQDDILMSEWPIGIHIHAFNWCQNQRPWTTSKGHYALCFKTLASFVAHHENLNEDRLPIGNLFHNLVLILPRFRDIAGFLLSRLSIVVSSLHLEATTIDNLDSKIVVASRCKDPKLITVVAWLISN